MASSDDIAAEVRARPPRKGRDAEAVLDGLKREAITELVGVLSGFWSSIEEQVRLAALAGYDFSASQEDRVMVIGLSHRALELATRYREAVEHAFELWREPGNAPPPPDSLELMSEGELEIHLAGQQITELLEHQFLHPLAQLDERLEALAASIGIEGTPENPLRPAVAVKAFVDLFEPEDLTPRLRELIFQQLDKRLPKVLAEVYSKANATLATAEYGGSGARLYASSQGRPDARAARQVAEQRATWIPDGGLVESIPGSASGARSGGPADAEIVPGIAGMAVGGPAAGAQSPGDPLAVASPPLGGSQGQPMRYRDIVREQLHAWRARGGLRAEPAEEGESAADEVEAMAEVASEAVGQMLGTSDMLQVASLLQGEDPTPFSRVLAGEDKRALADVIRAEVLEGMRQLGFDPENVRLDTDDQDAIDLVGILFQSLFSANELLQRARDMYGRLVVPYLKIALTDDSMFNRRSHPARRLLDALTEACDGNTGSSPQDRQALDCAEHAVDRVVQEYREDQTVFELAADELREHLEQQRRRAAVAGTRAAEAIHGRERLRAARGSAEGLVSSRMANRPLTGAVAHFLDHHWRHHLTQTWLRDGPESARHHAAISLGDAMVQVDADAAQVRGRAVADQLLALQVPLGECYSSCGLDADAARDAMARIISALALPDTPRLVHSPQGGDGESDEGAEESGVPLRLAGGTDGIACDPAVAARMRRLRVGQGLRLVERGGRETAARVAWISPLTSRLLIVNRRGMRKLVVSPEELAVLVSAGRVIVRSVDSPFDEAMKQLWQHISQAPPTALKAANGG